MCVCVCVCVCVWLCVVRAYNGNRHRNIVNTMVYQFLSIDKQHLIFKKTISFLLRRHKNNGVAEAEILHT